MKIQRYVSVTKMQKRKREGWKVVVKSKDKDLELYTNKNELDAVLMEK